MFTLSSRRPVWGAGLTLLLAAASYACGDHTSASTAPGIPVSVSGTVDDLVGHPLPGARVSTYGIVGTVSAESVSTDERGSFALLAGSGAVGIYAERAGYVGTGVAWSPETSGAVTIRLQAQILLALGGGVSDALLPTDLDRTFQGDHSSFACHSCKVLNFATASAQARRFTLRWDASSGIPLGLWVLDTYGFDTLASGVSATGELVVDATGFTSFVYVGVPTGDGTLSAPVAYQVQVVEE